MEEINDNGDDETKEGNNLDDSNEVIGGIISPKHPSKGIEIQGLLSKRQISLA